MFLKIEYLTIDIIDDIYYSQLLLYETKILPQFLNPNETYLFTPKNENSCRLANQFRYPGINASKRLVPLNYPIPSPRIYHKLVFFTPKEKDAKF